MKKNEERTYLDGFVLGIQMIAVAMMIYIVGIASEIKQINPVKHKPVDDTVKELVAPMVSMVRLGYGQGTGFHLKAGDKVVFITNRHVCESSDEQENPIAIKGKYIKVGDLWEQVIAVDEYSDLCMITSHSYLGLKIAEVEPSEHDRIAIVGFPKGIALVQDGRIIHFTTEKYDWMVSHTKLMYISTPVRGGSSGSPVVNIKGEVVGVVFAMDNIGYKKGVAVPWHLLKDFVLQELYGMKPQHRTGL